jgi:hypothetical protein
MPGFDGTGPQGRGPMTGRGEGYCAIRIPKSGEQPYGYAGLQGTPVGGPPFARRLRPVARLRGAFRRRRGRGADRGRGRRFGRR